MQRVPGLMMFHCLHHHGSGAFSVLVDGFQVGVRLSNILGIVFFFKKRFYAFQNNII